MVATLQTLGLATDFIGALLLVLSDSHRWQNVLQGIHLRQQPITKLRVARDQLFGEGYLNKASIGFEDVADTIQKRVNLAGDIREIRFLEVPSRDSSLEIVYESGSEQHVYTDISGIQLDTYIQRDIESLRRQVREKYIRVGGAILSIGFFLQFLGTL